MSGKLSAACAGFAFVAMGYAGFVGLGLWLEVAWGVEKQFGGLQRILSDWNSDPGKGYLSDIYVFGCLLMILGGGAGLIWLLIHARRRRRG